MKRLLLAALAACAAVPAPAPPPPPPAEGEYRGVARVHDAHCGGAMLTEEQRARLLRPAANRRFLVFAGEHNSAGAPAAELATDAAGRFRVRLPAKGLYCVVDAARKRLAADEEARLLALPPSSPVDPVKGGVDEACRARLPLACEEAWDTAQPGFEARIDLVGSRCPWSQPCVIYNGPLPP